MEEKIKGLFEGPLSGATEHLGSGANVLITIGEISYALKITDEREVQVEKGGNGDSDLEIKGEEKIMNDLLDSSSLHDFGEKMKLYIKDRKSPKVMILMERTVENSKRFLRIYYHFVRKLYLLK